MERYDDIEFYTRFRFHRVDILTLVEEVAEELQLQNRTGALPPILQVLLTLRFYASGSFQAVCAELISVSQPTASRTISRVTAAFLKLVPRWIKFPSQKEADKSKQKLFQRHGMPNTIGCIDGTHVAIQAPKDNESEFVNRKHYHSINVQVRIRYFSLS